MMNPVPPTGTSCSLVRGTKKKSKGSLLLTRRRVVAVMDTTEGPTRLAASTMAVRRELSSAEACSGLCCSAVASCDEAAPPCVGPAPAEHGERVRGSAR